MKLTHLKYLYLLTILSSSLLYAFSTTKIIASTQLSPFTIIFMSTIMEIFIYIDLNYLKTLTTLITRAIGSIGIFIFFVIQLLFMRNLNDAIILLITYLICSLLFNIYLLCLENQIVMLNGNMRNGLISITLLRNISKILGFGLGALFQYISVWHYTFILLFTFIILCTVHMKNAKTPLAPILSLKHLNHRALIVFLLCLGSVAVFTIPQLIQDLHAHGMTTYSSLAFMLPGIFSILYLKYLKDTRFNQNFNLKSMTYISLISFYLILQYWDTFIFISMIIISIIITISISIIIDIRARFIQHNTQIALKNLLQFMNLISALSLLIFSVIALFLPDITTIILIINIVAASILMFSKHKSSEDGLST